MNRAYEDNTDLVCSTARSNSRLSAQMPEWASQAQPQPASTRPRERAHTQAAIIKMDSFT